MNHRFYFEVDGSSNKKHDLFSSEEEAADAAQGFISKQVFHEHQTSMSGDMMKAVNFGTKMGHLNPETQEGAINGKYVVIMKGMDGYYCVVDGVRWGKKTYDSAADAWKAAEKEFGVLKVEMSTVNFGVKIADRVKDKK